VTINNKAGLFESCYWNEYNLNPLTRNNWRASLVPAAAVIPAPIAYIKVVAVEKCVVELMDRLGGLGESQALHKSVLSFWGTMVRFIECHGEPGLLL
jgi:hypothetical protein